MKRKNSIASINTATIGKSMRFLLILMCMTMVYSSTLLTASAESSDDFREKKEITVDSVMSVIDEEDVKNYSDDLWLTDAFDVYVFPDEGKAVNGQAFFMIDNENDAIVAKYDVFDDGTVIYTDVSELGFSKFYRDDQAFALGFYDDDIMVSISETGEFFSSVEDISIDDYEYEVKKAEPIFPVKVPNNSKSGGTLVAEYKFTDGNCMGNGTNPDFPGRGLCWAAAIGSKIKWEKGINFNNVVAVYNYIKYTFYGGASLLGTEAVIENSISQLYSGVYQKTTSATAGFIYNGLCSNRRNIFGLSSTSSTAKHAVIINGITARTSLITLYVKDSNHYSSNSKRIYISTQKPDGSYMNPTEVMTSTLHFSSYYHSENQPYNVVDFSIY